MNRELESRDALREGPDSSGERQCFRDYLSRLSFSVGSFEIRTGDSAEPAGRIVSGGGGRAVRPGFLLHSLLGMGLRRVACTETPPCEGACRRPADCAYGRLLEPRPARTGLPLSGVERAPVPVAVDAPWGLYEDGQPLRFRVFLLGAAGDLRDTVTRALIEGLRADRDGRFHSVSLVPRGWQEHRAGGEGATNGGISARRDMRIEFVTPVRLLRNKREMEAFDLLSVVRDLSFRLAVWGYYHQGLPWPSPWSFLHEDMAVVRAIEHNMRPVSFRRYSGRQGRAIPMKGLLGSVELRSISHDLELLLRAGAACGIGKGASIGLGRIRISVN